MGVYNYDSQSDTLSLIAGGTFYADNPIGTILAFGGSNIPTGWHLCDGTALSRTTYKDLFNIIGTNFGVGDGSTTFNLPDLQGEFLRGAGTNGHSGQGSGSTVGTHQDATTIPSLVFYNANSGNTGVTLETGVGDPNSTGVQNQIKNYDAKVAPTTSPRQQIRIASSSRYTDGGNDIAMAVRPTNTSVNYIIKVYNTPLPLDLQNEVREVYSTEEHVIGQWIDGKPIYRKVFEVTSPSAGGTSVTTVTGALTGAYMVGLRCILHRSNPKGDFEAGSVNATTEYIKVWAKDDDIRMAVSDDFINCSASIIIEYTKNTD